MRCYSVLLAMVWLTLSASMAVAERPAVRIAAYDSLQVPRATQQVTFAREFVQRGDRVDQHLRVQLDLESTVRQGDKELEKSSTSLIRQQDRTVMAEEVQDGRMVAARVHFGKYVRTVDGQSSEPPVVGQTYRCRRLEDDTLDVTRDDGSFANPEEFAIVSDSMQALGRANPLSDFLAGKTITVGETLEVPLEVGAALLGSNDSLGAVSKFELVLKKVSADNGVATFDVEMETSGAETTQMRLVVNGQLDIETATCRTQRMTLSGPLGMATTIGSYSTAQTTYVRGKLKLDMSAQHN
jgi:hypothetical protein